QQVSVFAAVGLMAGCASLFESRLMEMRLLELVSLVAVAGQTGADRIRLQEARTFAGMGVVTSHAFSLGPGMRNFGLVDFVRLIAVTGRAERSSIGVGQDNLSVFRRGVAGIAGLLGKRRMGKFLHQLGQRRLVRIVALRASGRGKGLSLVSLDEGGVFDVVAVHAERGYGFGQVIVELLLTFFADFVRRVAGIASHVEGGVAAAFLWNIRSLSVASEAKIVF